jgi:hypothetical protein
MRPDTPRGIRNYNPGNIERTSTRWQGMALDQSGDSRFIVFSHPVWGIRAIARTLITYQDKHGLRTVQRIIQRWAPDSENNTVAYVAAVCARLHAGPGEAIDVYDYRTMLELVRAIVRHENGPGPLPGGDWYGEPMLAEGLALAGILRGVRHGEVSA